MARGFRRVVVFLSSYHQRLIRVQNTLLAFSYVAELEPDKRGATLQMIINRLLSNDVVSLAVDETPVATPENPAPTSRGT